jgi:hypothetical protein
LQSTRDYFQQNDEDRNEKRFNGCEEKLEANESTYYAGQGREVFLAYLRRVIWKTIALNSASGALISKLSGIIFNVHKKNVIHNKNTPKRIRAQLA